MKKYTQEEYDAIERDEYGVKRLPEGDYTQVVLDKSRHSVAAGCDFGDCRKFGAGCEFDAWCKFDDRCEFGDWCWFGDGCKVGDGCKFDDRCEFGDWCGFGVAHFDPCRGFSKAAQTKWRGYWRAAAL